MRLRLRLPLILGLVASLACAGEDKDEDDDDDDDDDDDTGLDTADADTDTDTDTDSDVFTVDVSVTSRGVELTTTGTNPGYSWFGIVQQGTEYDWEGEACTGGQEGYDFCHPFGARDLDLDVLPCMPDGTCTEQDLQDMSASTDTLFYSGLDGSWGWVLVNDDGSSCITGGDESSYYTALGCSEY